MTDAYYRSHLCQKPEQCCRQWLSATSGSAVAVAWEQVSICLSDSIGSGGDTFINLCGSCELRNGWCGHASIAGSLMHCYIPRVQTTVKCRSSSSRASGGQIGLIWCPPTQYSTSFTPTIGFRSLHFVCSHQAWGCGLSALVQLPRSHSGLSAASTLFAPTTAGTMTPH